MVWRWILLNAFVYLVRAPKPSTRASTTDVLLVAAEAGTRRREAAPAGAPHGAWR